MFHFRVMQAGDIPGLVSMEACSSSYPWGQSALQHSYDAGHQCIVCQSEAGAVPVAYAVSSRILDECSLLNICVSGDHQGQGIGKALINELIRVESRAGAAKMFLEVRESNTRAINLYEALGFTCDYIRRDYYPGEFKRENARVYSLSLSE